MPAPTSNGDGAYRAPMFPMRTVVLGAFVPTFVFGVGLGAMLPIIAPSAVARGADLATAGVVAALMPIGQILADIPAGALATRIGDRRAMIIAGLVAAFAFAGAALSPGLVTLGIAVLAVGAASAVYNLARHSYLTEITPPLQRARVLSTLGGIHRIAQFVGPFAGALVIHGGQVHHAYLLGAGTAVAATITIAVTRDKPGTRGPDAVASAAGPAPGLAEMLRTHRSMLTSLGLAVVLVGCVRGARQTVIPLWGEHLGLDPAVISLIFGLAGGIDMLLFYPAGKVMDRMGRLWIGVPSMLVMGAAMVALPFTGSATGLAVTAGLLGLGNGMSSGILMTLGSDVAPGVGRARFLGMWRVLQDSGMALGPLIVSGGAALGSLAAGIWVTGALGPCASAALARWVPRWTVHANRTTRRRAGIGDR
ncbi:MFS transporter [Georgenia halophila]|uniref:MFS transporter n=1 Tax=Georgenia halophila TaxID=620889 RepID=A0ABP8KU83_9MICO